MSKTKHKKEHLIISIEVMDWDSLFSHDLIGQHKVKVDINQENIHQKWLPLYDKEYNTFGNKKGEIQVTIEVENIWVGVKEIKLDDPAHTTGNQSTQKKKKGLFGL
ncbi:hypothetical protein RFI_11671 [Reticulomyxa filosa]|uniref:C2 domain-containing protein n=1 Tax=Reticulomyxa filosa TaxID=46433 RepID=X6NGM7_RETFI|nr:hypothetical protein RFI_11671 [Reticulomyxa filosa]|eukprot:ETO25465.1 hypothetical protein RFI_11671 [Reticulomyxa filosa]